MSGKNTLSTLLGVAAGTVGGAVVMGNMQEKSIKKWKTMSDKHLALFMLMNEWVKLRQEGKCIDKYFKNNGYYSIAIYGMSYVGERLLDELKGSGVDVKYAIDRNADSIYEEIAVYCPDDALPEVDVIVVTAVFFFDEIHGFLQEKVNCPIVSFEDILYEAE